MTEQKFETWETRNGVQRVRFEGVRLADSSSYVAGKPRWVEFTLFRTKSGQYVLYRVGRSYVYHSRNCPVVVKNRLGEYQEEHLPAKYTPCQECKPSAIELDGLFPETARYYTQASDTVEGVLAILNKKDKNGIEYLTNVAKELLFEAAQVDEQIKGVFFQTHID